MDRDCGWAKIIGQDHDDSVARGRVMLTKAPTPDDASPESTASRGQLTPQPGIWQGYLDSVRTTEGSDLALGSYRLRFEQNDEILHVRVTGWEGQGSEAVPGRADVVSADSALPSVLLEVGGE